MSYRDTSETKRLRAEVTALNRHLAAAHLGYLGNSARPDLAKRKLHRTFNLPPPRPADAPRFDMGGRLFGGFWLSGMSRQERQFITIAGQRTVELDFASMFVRLAYRHMDATPPEGDLYRMIDGVRSAEHREGVKKCINAFLFRQTPMQRLPRKMKELLPKGLCKVPDLRAAILRAHPALDGALDSAIGYRLMHTESNIMVAVLLRLNTLGITALPLHDGLMVAEDDGETARTVMLDVSEQHTGCRLPVSVKAPGSGDASRPTW